MTDERSEDLQAGHELIDAYCMNITGDPAPLDGGPGGLLIGNRIAELEGGT